MSSSNLVAGNAQTSTLTILAALTKSRSTLLFDTLPLFSTKSRSKSAPQLVQPPHSLSQTATLTVTFGPHSFPRTKLFTVEWIDPTPPPKPKPALPPPPSPAASAANAITPALIMRLNSASAADPQLASVLRKAAAGQANNAELSSLARYIEAMRREEEIQNPTPPPLAPVASTSSPTADVVPPPPPRPPSIVIEFRESATERFVLPSHFTVTVLPPSASAPANSTRRSLLLSFFVFPGDREFDKENDKEKGKMKDTGIAAPVAGPSGTGDSKGPEGHKGKPVPVSMMLEDCTEATRNAVWRASRSSRDAEKKQNEEWWKKMVRLAPR